MKKCVLICLLLTALVPQTSFAQEFSFSGEIKTGVYWETRQMGEDDPVQFMQMGNTDDAGGFSPADKKINIPGRFRLNLELKPINSMGFRVRFQDEKFTGQDIYWAYAYAYGNFLKDQLKISAGNLGESPWATGGPEIWAAIDERPGIRTEYKPEFVPGLNIGFVLNNRNGFLDTGEVDDFACFMKETVLGIAYVHEFFVLRFAWRLDGYDAINYTEDEGHYMVYRLEEKTLALYVPGLSVYANGYWVGLVDGLDSMKKYQNWLYIAYSNFNIKSELRLGYEAGNPKGDDFNRKLFTIKPVFSYAFTPMFSAGFTFAYSKDFGKPAENLAFERMTIEPQVKVTFNQNAYVVLVYGFQQVPRTDVMEQANYINLRLVYSF